MHSVKKHIPPKYVKYVSSNILPFNEKYFWGVYFILCLLEENTNSLFSWSSGPITLPFFPSCKNPSIGIFIHCELRGLFLIGYQNVDGISTVYNVFSSK